MVQCWLTLFQQTKYSVDIPNQSGMLMSVDFSRKSQVFFMQLSLNFLDFFTFQKALTYSVFRFDEYKLLSERQHAFWKIHGC